MKNYKKISLFLLLSTVVTSNAFNPYDTSGKPDLGDFDDPSGGPISTSSAPTILENEVKKQNPTPRKAAHQPIPTKHPKDPSFEKQQKREAEDKKQNEAANRLVSEFIDICSEIEKMNVLLQKERDAETTYNNALKEIAEQRNFSRYEKLFMGVAVVAGAATIITNTVENAPKYAAIATASILGTGWSYITRYRSCAKAEKEFITAHETELEQAAKNTCTAVKTKEQLIKNAEAKLAELETQTFPYTQVIAGFEANLNRLKV